MIEHKKPSPSCAVHETLRANARRLRTLWILCHLHFSPAKNLNNKMNGLKFWLCTLWVKLVVWYCWCRLSCKKKKKKRIVHHSSKRPADDQGQEIFVATWKLPLIFFVIVLFCFPNWSGKQQIVIRGRTAVPRGSFMGWCSAGEAAPRNEAAAGAPEHSPIRIARSEGRNKRHAPCWCTSAGTKSPRSCSGLSSCGPCKS